MSEASAVRTRREVIGAGLRFAGIACVTAAAARSGAVFAQASASPAQSCDASHLAPIDVSFRESLEYTDHSAEGEKVCRKCVSFLPSTAAFCGACSVVKGPVSPQGHCTSWSDKA